MPAEFSEIVACVPSEVVAFFDRFEEVRGNLTLHQEIDVLNAVAEDEFRLCVRQKRPTVLMKWFEVFRDLYILHRVREQGDGDAVRKNPDNFTTFARKIVIPNTVLICAREDYDAYA